jgi:hypothetical protein
MPGGNEREPRRNIVKIADIPNWIRTERLPNIRLGCYSYTVPLGGNLLQTRVGKGWVGTWRPHLAVIKRAIKIKVKNGKGGRAGGRG